jgi:ligand-binding sensor domain-containing protein
VLRTYKLLACIVCLIAACGETRATDVVRHQLSETWTSFVLDDGDKVFDNGITDIVEYDGSLWIGTDGRGLWRYRDEIFEDISSHIHSSNVRAILKGGDGALWICYDGLGDHDGGNPRDKEGVARYQDGNWQQFDMPNFFPGYAVKLKIVFSTKDGALWFFSNGHLLRFKNGLWSVVSGVETPRAFLEAHDGSIWITGEGGDHIWRSLNGDAFEPIKPNNGVKFEYPNNLVETPDGTIWIGDYGLTYFRNGQFGRIEATKPLFADNRIWPEFAAHDGTLYVASAFNGLYTYRDGEWVTGEHTSWGYADVALEAQDGSIWYAVGGVTNPQLGVARYAAGAWIRSTDIVPNVVSDIGSLHEGADGSIWAGIKTGYIARFSGGAWHTIPGKPPRSYADSSESVSSWCNASDGSMWIGMKKGELRRFSASRAGLKATVTGNIATLALTVNRGRTNQSSWSIEYGFSASAETPPSESFVAPFGSQGELSLPLPPASQRSFLHAFAFDPDGTIILLADGTALGSLMVSAGSNIPDLPVPAGVLTEIDGQALSEGPVQFRGDKEDPGSSIYQGLTDGFHSAQVELQNSTIRLTLWKDKQVLKVFQPFGRSVAVVVAVSTYGVGSGYPALPAAERQAKQLADALRGMGFETIVLSGPDATKDKIRRAIADTNLGPDDRLLFYFGGHGDARTKDGDDVGYIVPFDAKKVNLEGTGLPLAAIINSQSRARQVIYVFDSCASGLALKRGDIDKNQLRRVKAYQDIRYYAQNGRMVLTAGALGEAAIDVNGGIFTRALIDGIRGAADREVGDNNGVVDFYELFAYLHREVTNEASNKGFLQHPDFSTSGGVGRFFFVTDRSLTK